MGVVFLAIHERLGREVAIKVLRKEFAGSEDVVRRFQQEAEAVTRIGHPHIVAVYDTGRLPDGGLYYVMERVGKETLGKRMAREPLSTGDLLDVFGQLLSALQAAHDVGVVHRDLKPDNVVLTQTGPGERPVIKLLDFGVAKMRDDQRAGPLTHSGALIGTPQYMAPEQIKGAERVDRRADVYAAGVMLYEALSGHPPFSGRMLELLQAHLHLQPAPPSEAARRPDKNGMSGRTGVDWPRLDAIVLRALAKAPEDRYPDCRSLLLDLDAALRPLLKVTQSQALALALPTVPLPMPVTVPLPAPPGQKRRRALQTILFGTLFACGTGTALLAWRRHERGELDKGPPARPAPEVLSAQVRAQATRIMDQAQGGPAEARRGVVAAIEEVGGPRLLPRILTALHDDNPAVRRAAAAAAAVIGRPGDEVLGAALREAAGRSVGSTAVEVAAARLALGEEAAAEELRALSGPDAEPLVRLRAVLALSQAGRAPARLLRQALEIALRAGAVPWPLRRNTLARLVLLEDQAALAQIERSLGQKDRTLRLEAAEVLARAGQKRGRDLLVQGAAAPPEPDPIAALAEVGDPRAVPPLLLLLRSENVMARRRAATALGHLAVSGTWPLDPAALAPLLSDPQGEVAVAVAVALLGAAPAAG